MAANGVWPVLAGHGVVVVWVHHVQTTLRATDDWACLQAQPKMDDTLEVARWQGEAKIGQRRGGEVPRHPINAQRQEAPLVAHVAVSKQEVVLSLVHQVHDLGLDASARRLGVKLEDLVQGNKVVWVDALTQVLKLDAQVVNQIRVDVVATEQFVDQVGGVYAQAYVGGIEVVLNDANG